MNKIQSAGDGKPRGETDQDSRLLDLIRQRAPGAFDLLVHIHLDNVARLVHRLLGWPDAVEDVVQEVFLSVLKHLNGFRGDASVSTWLARITINKCREETRRRWLRQAILWRQMHQPPAQCSAVARAVETEQLGVVRQAVRRLPTALREVVVLRYLQEMPVGQICKALGLTESAVNVRLHRARAALKGLLVGISEE